MKITRNLDDSLTLRIEPFLVPLLLEIPTSADPLDHPAAWERLYPEPFPQDENASREWKEFVQPEMSHLFASALEIVSDDLAPLSEEDDETDEDEENQEITIPAAHFDAWLSALNQARLVLGARHALGAEELHFPADVPFVLENERQIAAFKIEFYAIIMEFMLGALDK